MPKRNITLTLELVKQSLLQYGDVANAAKNLTCHRDTLNKFIKRNNISFSRKPRKRLSEEAKKNISEKRKLFLSQNPDKHPWRNNNKFKSIPCEKIKEWLKSKNLQFIEEYNPQIPDHNYSIDIAFPDKKIGLEINGNQHYNRDGSLKPYYAQREREIENDGWKLYQLHYSICFKIQELENLINSILISPQKITFGYQKHIATKMKGKTIYLCKCGKEKDRQAKKCSICSHIDLRKIPWPSKEELLKLVWSKPTSTIAKDLGVSDSCISKWCKQYFISKPPRGYWAKQKAIKLFLMS